MFGEVGSGKSSIINMIVGQTVAEVSMGIVQGTLQPERHEVSIDGTCFNIYDTVGLNEGEQGRVPHWKAVHQLYTLIRTLDGVSLLVYCIRGRINESARADWTLFSKILCDKKVPIIAVETGLEEEEDFDRKRTLLKETLERDGMVPGGVECVVSIRGRKNEHEERYNSSQRQLRRLIMRSFRREPWSMTTDDWIGHIYKTTYTTKLWFFPDVRVEFAKEVGNLIDEFIEETGMKKDEAEKLKSTLLDAERKLRKKLSFR